MSTNTFNTLRHQVDFSADITDLYNTTVNKERERSAVMPLRFRGAPISALAITFLVSHPYRHPQSRASESLTIFPLSHQKSNPDFWEDSDYAHQYHYNLAEQTRQLRMPLRGTVSIPSQLMWGEWNVAYHDDALTKFNSNQNQPREKDIDRATSFIHQVRDYISSEAFDNHLVFGPRSKNDQGNITHGFHLRMVPDIPVHDKSFDWLLRYARAMKDQKLAADTHATYLSNTGQSPQKVFQAVDKAHSYWRSYDSALREIRGNQA